jgi:hypothetical protein
MRHFLINVDDLPKLIGHLPHPEADLSAFAKGLVVAEELLHKVFGWQNHNGRKIDIQRLDANEWITEASPAETPPSSVAVSVVADPEPAAAPTETPSHE